MKGAMLRVAVITLIMVSGCTSESGFPDPTGKGTVRALNAIQGSPSITFRIEERTIEALGYKESSAGTQWDDFDYRFNFDTFILGEDDSRRIASLPLKVDADRDYTFVLTGALTSPDVTVWETDERTFDGSETVFEARFANLTTRPGNVDVYFAAEGTAPSLGEAVATLGPNEVLPPMDFEGGEYVLTLTAAGDPGEVVYQSDNVSYLSLASFLIVALDGDERDIAPTVVRRVNSIGGTATLADARFPANVRFIHASIDLPPSDVYDDEMLSSQVLSDHRFKDVSPPVDVEVGTTDFTYTAVGNSSAVQFESSLAASAGTRYHFAVHGEDMAQTVAAYVPLLQSITTAARLQVQHFAVAHDSLDLYITGAGLPLDDESAQAQTLLYSFPSSVFSLEAGSYDVYATVNGETTVVAGPLRLDLELGDVVELVIFDTVDPATAELRQIPQP